MRLLLLGPTASGKTDLSVRLARKISAEIISADSRQCYKYLNIGTATPAEDEQKGITHYNLSIIDPRTKDSAADFYDRAKNWEQDIQSRGKNILYVGGSTLHLQCVIQPLDDLPPSNETNLKKLEQEAETHGIRKLYGRLLDVDPEYAQKMDGMNPQRIFRALDVWMQTGRPFSSFHSDERTIEVPSDMIVFGLKRDREELYTRINRRVERMFEEGFLDEVRELLDMGYTADDPGINTVGYNEAIAFLKDEISRDRMIKDMKTRTRRYAKRQLTWFRRWDFINWIDMSEESTDSALKIILGQVAAKLNKD